MDCFESRLDRISGREHLTGAFFSSGAEPRLHLEKLITAAISAAKQGHGVVIFTRTGGKLDRLLRKAFRESHISFETVSSSDSIPVESPDALIVRFGSRREENVFAGKLFRRFDYFVAPSHERSNWALGLGLPIFVVGPPIGPFAPLNRDNLVSAGVAGILKTREEARDFGGLLERLRGEGRLGLMSRAGWGKFDINGFETIATFLCDKYGRH
jgi:hypothetical protein